MKLAWTDKFYWPAIVSSGSAIAITIGAAVGAGAADDIVQFAEVVLGVFAAFLFVLLLIDGEARRAVDAYNHEARLARGRRWSERLFPKAFDRSLLVLGLCAWLEIAGLNLLGQQDLAVLPFLGFAVVTLMAMLMLKRRPISSLPTAERPELVEKEIGLWFGGEGGD